MLAVVGALVASAACLSACGDSSPSPLGGERTQAVANWLKQHRCENVTRTDAKGTAPNPDYGLFLERARSAVLVACDKGPEDSAIVWEFDDYDTMSRSLHVHAEEIRGGPYCRLRHVSFTIGNVKDGVGLCRSMLGDLVCTSGCGRRYSALVTQASWSKAEPRTIESGPCAGHRAEPAELAGTGSGAATQVILLTPVDRRGCLRPNIHLVSRNGGGCQGGRPSAYRCTWDNFIGGHCWASVFDSPTPTSVVCMSRPWSPVASRVDMAPGAPRALKLDGHPAPNGKFPWGVELVDGRRCLAFEGAHSRYDGPDRRYRGRTIDYYCGEPGGCVLLRGVDKSSPLWTLDVTCRGDTRYGEVRQEPVHTAWFAG